MNLNTHQQSASSIPELYMPTERADEGRSNQASASIWDSLDTEDVNATSHIKVGENPQQVLRELQSIFKLASFEKFEVGMESEFVRSLTASVAKHGTRSVLAIASIILTGQAKPLVAAEALRWLGELTHRESKVLRLKVLEVSLSHPSRWVRDAAALGLDSMGDLRAIPSLQAAIEREYLPELRKDLLSVLHQLQQM